MRLPGETSAQAFTRIFCADADEVHAIRAFLQVAKLGSIVSPIRNMRRWSNASAGRPCAS